jgi:hypothetical protein
MEVLSPPSSNTGAGRTRGRMAARVAGAVESRPPALAPACATVEEWMVRCCSRLLELDPLLPPHEVGPIVEEMSARARWRAMPPEEAANRVFVPHPRRAQTAARMAVTSV